MSRQQTKLLTCLFIPCLLLLQQFPSYGQAKKSGIRTISTARATKPNLNSGGSVENILRGSLENAYNMAPPITLSGIVTDGAENKPLAGVTITVKRSNKTAVSNNDGSYRIQDVESDDVLVFTYVGYTLREIPVFEARGGTLQVALEKDVVKLNEVVVVGYGTQKKTDLTGSIVSIGSKDFVKNIATDALQLIAGKAAGVNVTQANAEPGGGLNITIRGAGSINSSNSVLVVIDGLPGGNTANINPADIESIEILKDASAAAIYGTRAANGVLLITTKKGKEGTTKISYNTNVAFQSPSYKFDVLNATQYMQMINDISKDAGITIPYTAAQVAAAGAGTNWQDQLMRNALATNHQLSLSGGSKQAKYYTSFGYIDQKGILISSGIKKYNVLVNLEVNPNNKFRFGVNMNASLNVKDKIANESNSGGENADPLNAALMFDPRLSPIRKDNGEYERNASIALDNPVALAHGYDYREQNNSIYGNTFAEYQFLPGLKAIVRLGGNINNIRNDEYSDRTTQRGAAFGGISNVISTNLNYYLMEGLLNYDRVIGDHHITFVGGSTREKFGTLTQRSYGTGFLSDVTNTNLLQSGNALTNQVNSGKTVYKLQSYLGRLNYTFRERYLLTATIRRDGTSRFSEANKFANFPSVALGWRISEESFLKNSKLMNNLKLRVGYGQMGNEGISNFETIPTFVAGGNTVLGGVQIAGAQPARIANPELTWETTEEYNFGLDFGLFNNRVSGSVDYFIKNSLDQLFNKPVPMSTGFTNIRTNFGTVRNSGIDISVNTRNVTGPFQWNTNFTFSTLKNNVVQLPPYVGDIITGGIVANIPGFALVRQGVPMRAFYGYQVTGVFQNKEEVTRSAQPTAKPGEPIFLDLDNNGKIDASDRTILGKPFPTISYSINNSFSYKNFNLEVYFLGVKGIETFNANVLESMFPINFDRNIMTKHYVNRWTSQNPNTGYPSGVNSAIYFGGGRMINSYTVQDASFVRLRNVTLGYNVPLRSTRLFHGLMFTLSGENLLTVTNFDGYDPEANQTGDGSTVEKSSYNNYPAARVIRFGARIDF